MRDRPARTPREGAHLRLTGPRRAYTDAPMSAHPRIAGDPVLERDHVAAVGRTLAMFAAFCLASGATYLLNDAKDAEADRLNPRTASRPIARGDLSATLALACAAGAALVGLGVAALINWQSIAVLGGYMVLQLGYSHGLKHMLFIDV